MAILLVLVFVVDAVTAVGRIIVVLPATKGACNVTDPDVSPLTTMLLISPPSN